MAIDIKKNITFVIKIIVTITIFWLLFNSIDLSTVLESLKNVQKNYIFAVFCILLVQVLVASFRWKTILFHINIIASPREILKILWIGLFFNQVLPSSFGGDAFRGYYLYKKDNTIGDAVMSVILDRMIGFISLVLFVIATLFLALGIVNEPIARLGVLTISIGATLAVFFVLSLDLLTQNFLPIKLFKGLYSLAIQGRGLVFTISPGIKLLVTGVLIHSLTFIVYILLSISMNLDVNLFQFAIILPVLSLLTVVPISLAGWGIREGVMVIGLGYLGVLPEDAFALSILYGILLFIASLPGMFIWLFNGKLRVHKVN